MAKFIANPVVVDAYKISRIFGTDEDGTVTMELEGAKGNHVASPAMVSRMTPVVGDYWVVQSDGYIYLNPKDVFERKYHHTDEINPEHPVTSSLRGHWHKIAALLLFKWGQRVVVIRKRDIEDFTRTWGDDAAVLAHDKKDDLQLSLLTAEEAQKRARN